MTGHADVVGFHFNDGLFCDPSLLDQPRLLRHEMERSLSGERRSECCLSAAESLSMQTFEESIQGMVTDHVMKSTKTQAHRYSS